MTSSLYFETKLLSSCLPQCSISCTDKQAEQKVAYTELIS